VCIFSRAFAAKHVYLDEVHGVDIRIAQLGGADQHLVAFEQFRLPRHRKYGAHRAMELSLEHVVNALADTAVFDRCGAEAGRSQVDLSQRQLNVAQQVTKEFPAVQLDIQSAP
jgi:hypothetical protein